MERHDTIQHLKRGEFPDGFSQRLGATCDAVQGCIRDMLSQGSTDVTVQSLKRRWSSIQASHAET